jgi:hypothetical protein
MNKLDEEIWGMPATIQLKICLPINYLKTIKVYKNYSFASFVWVSKKVSHIKGKTKIVGA